MGCLHASNSVTEGCVFFPRPCLPLLFPFEAEATTGDSGGGNSSSPLLMKGVSGTYYSQNVLSIHSFDIKYFILSSVM